jgi:hypothetical protein
MDATTFGLYCAFGVASIDVTGKPRCERPPIVDACQLISRTAANARHYRADWLTTTTTGKAAETRRSASAQPAATIPRCRRSP